MQQVNSKLWEHESTFTSLNSVIEHKTISKWYQTPLALTSKQCLISNKKQMQWRSCDYRKHQLPIALKAEVENYRKIKLPRIIPFKFSTWAQQSGKLFLFPAVVHQARI